MIEIIKQEVEMPRLPTHRRYRTMCIRDKWKVIDTHNNDETCYKGSYENVMIACYNLNKKFYLEQSKLNTP